MYYCRRKTIRSFGPADESHLAADKSIWDECWSPGAAWRSPSPHLGSVIERSPRSRSRRPVGRLRGKCGQTETRADEQDQRCCWPPFNAGKTIAGCGAREEEKAERRGSGGGGGGEVEGGGCINGPLYCFVLLKLRAQISWQHFKRTRSASSSSPGFSYCFRLQRPEKTESTRRLPSDGTEAGGGDGFHSGRLDHHLTITCTQLLYLSVILRYLYVTWVFPFSVSL